MALNVPVINSCISVSIGHIFIWTLTRNNWCNFQKYLLFFLKHPIYVHTIVCPMILKNNFYWIFI